MKKEKEYQYWFTTEYGDCACNDFVGTYSMCELYAQKMCDLLGMDIYINCGEDIVGVVFPDEYF